MKKRILLIAAAGSLLLSCSLMKSSPTKMNDTVKGQNTVKADTTKKDSARKLRPYNEIITPKALTQNGLFKVHQLNERWYFEIADSLLNKDILVVNRISKAPSLVAYGGDQIGEIVIQFSKGPGNKLLVKRAVFTVRANDTGANSISKAIENSNYQSIVSAFDIKTVSPDSAASVIDMTDYLNSDNPIFAFRTFAKGGTLYTKRVDGFQPDKSFISGIQSFPSNIEIKTVKTYNAPVPASFELNSSIVLLPVNPMKPRFWDRRIGYFAEGYYNYQADRPVQTNFMINRWRLEPRREDIGKYKKGELVEPAKPIVFYIDPATPKKWVPYLIQGVKDWQKAFEKAGFKNAIYALEVSPEDTTWNINDARHSVIVYKASEIQNASGPHISDPRTGEILESHIDWYHNIQQLVHDWYMIQAGPSDPGARKMDFDDDLMGRLIRYVCAHEVGHTLGLQHNFFASSTVPVDSLHSKAYIEKNGYCPSIMDYARFNYVAQPKDGLSREELIPRIGIYDEWAIEWGYKWFDRFANNEEEQSFLKGWATSMLNSDKRLWFGQQPISAYNLDPTRQSEDIGDDAVKAGYYGINNLKRIVPQLKEWTVKPNDSYESLRRVNSSLWFQYFTYLSHAALSIGGVSWLEKYDGQTGYGLQYTSRKQQKDALQFLVKELFLTPEWILNDDIYRRIASDPSLSVFPGYMNKTNIVQRVILEKITSFSVCSNLLTAQASSPGNNYSVDELFTDLENGIWQELKRYKPVDIYRRNLQKAYAERLIIMIAGYFATTYYLDKDSYPLITATDVYPIIKKHLKFLSQLIHTALSNYRDEDTRIHLVEMQERIKKVLKDQPNSWMAEVPLSERGKNNALYEANPEHQKNTSLFGQKSSCWKNEFISEELAKLLEY